MKVSLFLDFWNFSLTLKRYDVAYRPDWYKIADVFSMEAGKILKAKLELQDFNIFGSYSKSDADKKLRGWVNSYLPKIPGANVQFYERRQKTTGPICPVCHTEVKNCPQTECGASMLGTEEKCIDTLIATTMLQDAWQKKYDVAVLVSGDKDFIPAVEFLKNQGVKTIHAQFGHEGMELSNKCWGRFNVLKITNHFKLSKKLS